MSHKRSASSYRFHPKTWVIQREIVTKLLQSTPYVGHLSLIYFDFISETVAKGSNSLLSARLIGIYSSASAKALTAYWSTELILSASLWIAK